MKKFNINAIEDSLYRVQKVYKIINQQLKVKRDDLSDGVIYNIILGYDYINELLSNEIDLFNLAGQYSMVELNHIILCGKDMDKRLEYHEHILETRKRFQQGIKSINQWYRSNINKKKPHEIAVGFYIRALSQPQLFFEGNHRTENIIINYLLVGFGELPVVIDDYNAYQYFEYSAEIKHSKRGLAYYIHLKKQEKNIYNFLKTYGNNRYLDF